jgi:hypothetical protein
MTRFVLPVLLVVFGFCWLLAEMKVFDIGKMMWTMGLLCAGVALFIHGGVNKATFVLGGFLICGSVMSLLRYNGVFSMEIEVPVLVMIFGALMTINQTRFIPQPPRPSHE